jgi:hypothetical protein
MGNSDVASLEKSKQRWEKIKKIGGRIMLVSLPFLLVGIGVISYASMDLMNRMEIYGVGLAVTTLSLGLLGIGGTFLFAGKGSIFGIKKRIQKLNGNRA